MFAQADDVPHQRLSMPCEDCHTTETFNAISFDHARHTGYDLDGKHKSARCSSCHNLKDFSTVEKNCFNCHQDVHESKMGPDCARCHSSSTWTSFDFQEIHLNTDFPFMGRHALVDCQSCHQSLPQGDIMMDRTRCVDCHQSEYLNASGPNHVADGFSTECQNCHRMNGWRPATIPNHEIYFPIYNGNHAGVWNSCATCHINPSNNQDFSCLNCHEHNQNDMDGGHGSMPGYAYNSADCYLCHPDGRASDFKEHDAQFFPIYSGSHASEWSSCTECHNVPTDRKQFNCLSCHVHRQEEMDGKHGDMTGYGYDSRLCYECHPQGLKGQFAAHDAEFFPIFSGRHSGTWNDCLECHTLSSDRKMYDCLTCHPGGDVDPVHNGMTGYVYESTSCYSCHPTGEAGSFTAHDGQYFPIFSGRHRGTWGDCIECHTNPGDKKLYDCLTCHPGGDVDPVHNGMTGYLYESSSCYTCHPTGEAGQFIVHDGLYFPIFSGRHLSTWNDCIDCHTNPNDRKVIDCLTCHPGGQVDPVHLGMTGYSYDSPTCYSCHPTGEAGEFTAHDGQYFPIFSGTHANQWTDCTSCHPLAADKTIFDCISCHPAGESNLLHGSMSGYTATNDACYNCHPTGQKGTFTGHDNQFFPVFSGVHSGRWADCTTCHTVPGDRTSFTCFECHEHSQARMDDKHLGQVSGYGYDSDLCLSCHPDGRVG